MIAKATISVRMPSGRFPAKSVASILLDARKDVKRDVEAAFAKQRDPVTGRPWPARKVARPNTMLVRTGRLKAGVLAAVDAGTAGSATLVIRLDAPAYARWHQSGTRVMARRRVLGVSKLTRDRVARRLAAVGVRVFRGLEVL